MLQPDEIELIRLIDLEGLEQEEAAEKLGVSRKTAWRDLHEARRKIADALVNGKGIEMAGCTRAAEGRCPKCPKENAAQNYVRFLFKRVGARHAGTITATGRCIPSPAPHTFF